MWQSRTQQRALFYMCRKTQQLRTSCKLCVIITNEIAALAMQLQLLQLHRFSVAFAAKSRKRSFNGQQPLAAAASPTNWRDIQTKTNCVVAFLFLQIALLVFFFHEIHLLLLDMHPSAISHQANGQAVYNAYTALASTQLNNLRAAPSNSFAITQQDSLKGT